jgi:hypothetical protein
LWIPGASKVMASVVKEASGSSRETAVIPISVTSAPVKALNDPPGGGVAKSNRRDRSRGVGVDRGSFRRKIVRPDSVRDRQDGDPDCQGSPEPGIPPPHELLFRSPFSSMARTAERTHSASPG